MDALFASIKGSSERLAVTRPVIRRLVAEGRLRAVQIPGVSRVLIPVEELQRFAREECIPVRGAIRPPRNKRVRS